MIRDWIGVTRYRRKGRVTSQRGGDGWSRLPPDPAVNAWHSIILVSPLTVTFILDFGKTWLEMHTIFRFFHVFLYPVSTSCRSSGCILAGVEKKGNWGRDQWEIRHRLVPGSWHTHSAWGVLPHTPLLCLGAPCACGVPFFFFLLNQSG